MTVFSELGIEGNFLNLIMSIYEKPIVNIILNNGGLNVFHLKSRTRHESLLLPFLFNIILKALARVIRKKRKKEKQAIHIEKEKVKLSLFSDDIILYVQNLRNPLKNY